MIFMSLKYGTLYHFIKQVTRPSKLKVENKQGKNIYLSWQL